MHDLLRTYFKQQEWHYENNDSDSIFYLVINGENGRLQCVADLNLEDNSLIFFSIAKIKTPVEQRLNMAELLTRINYDTFLGNFDLNFEDGEIRYKTSIVYSGVEPDINWIDNLIMTNLIIMDRCLPGFINLIFKNMSPIEAFKLVKEEQSQL